MSEDDKANSVSDEYHGVLGLEHQVVRFHEPTALWEELYRQEERRLRGALAALSSLVIDIQHFGSTAIPDIKAKPILDILVGIQHFEAGPQCVAPLEALGYEFAPQAGIPGDYTFGKGNPRTHLVHVVEYGGTNWTKNLRFRDALRLNPALAREYETLKLRLGQEHSQSRANYTEAKTDFIQQVLGLSSHHN